MSTLHIHMKFLFTTHTYLTFVFSLVNADGKNAAGAWIRVRVELFTRSFLSPSHPTH